MKISLTHDASFLERSFFFLFSPFFFHFYFLLFVSFFSLFFFLFFSSFSSFSISLHFSKQKETTFSYGSWVLERVTKGNERKKL